MYKTTEVFMWNLKSRYTSSESRRLENATAGAIAAQESFLLFLVYNIFE